MEKIKMIGDGYGNGSGYGSGDGDDVKVLKP